MNTETEINALKAWMEKALTIAPKEGGGKYYLIGVCDFKASLREEIEKELAGYIHKRDGWKEGSKDYEAYDLAVRVLQKQLQLIDTVKPLTSQPEGNTVNHKQQ